MNKWFAAALSTIILTVGGTGATYALNINQTAQVTEQVQLQQLPEYSTITAHTNIESMSAKIVEDSSAKRIIVFSNTSTKGQMKSIFLKNKNIVKIIDLKNSIIYNGAIIQPSTSEASIEKSYPEQQVIASYVDVSRYHSQVVEDHANKRVIVFNDNIGREQFKAMFIKNTKELKIINTRGGLVYKGIIQ